MKSFHFPFDTLSSHFMMHSHFEREMASTSLSRRLMVAFQNFRKEDEHKFNPDSLNSFVCSSTLDWFRVYQALFTQLFVASVIH